MSSLENFGPAEPPANPAVVVIGGPNGAGKSTVAPVLLQGALAVNEYVNADTIASGISGFRPETVALAAGEIMLRRLDVLAEQRLSFAFETTLASRSFVSRLTALRQSCYEVTIVILWLASAELAISRVQERVRSGGHHVPEDIVRRRYNRGLENFFRLYRQVCHDWRFYDNSGSDGARLIASGGAEPKVVDAPLWHNLELQYA